MPKRRDENAPFWTQMRQAERRIIEYALEHGQTLKKTATLLGISPNYLSERTRELGIPTPDSKPGPKPGTPKPRPTAQPSLRVVDDGDVPAEVTEAIASDADVAAAEDEELEDEDEDDADLEDEDGADLEDEDDDDEEDDVEETAN
jgi:hypothetical protein